MNNNKANAFIKNIVGGILIILIGLYIVFFKKDDLTKTAYLVSSILLIAVGAITTISIIMIYLYIKKNKNI